MNTILIGFGVVVAALVGGGLLVTFLARAKYNEGKKDEQLAEVKASTEAKAKGDAVLAEHRDPASVDERLRRGDF